MCVQQLSRNEIKEYILGRFLACVKVRKKERKKTKRKKTERNKKRTNEQTDERTYERKYAGLTFKRKLFCCLSKYCAKLLVIVVFKKSRGDSKRELGIKFNPPYFIANVSLTLVHAHVYERYVNFASYCTAKKCTFIHLANMYCDVLL